MNVMVSSCSTDAGECTVKTPSMRSALVSSSTNSSNISSVTPYTRSMYGSSMPLRSGIFTTGVLSSSSS